jgi:hypothetical protein
LDFKVYINIFAKKPKTNNKILKNQDSGLLKEYRMVFRAGLRDPCTRDVLRFTKVEQHHKCMDYAILLGKPFGNCFIK